VSIAKAGIITTLNARTSILAAANPINSRYDPKLPIPANIDLPPTLISRFDLLYLVLDKVDEMNDRRLAKHLVSLYLEDRPDTAGADVIVSTHLRGSNVADRAASRDAHSFHNVCAGQDQSRAHTGGVRCARQCLCRDEAAGVRFPEPGKEDHSYYAAAREHDPTVGGPRAHAIQ
jgi:hypothetical protein